MCPPVENRLKVNLTLCFDRYIDSNQPQILTQSRPLYYFGLCLSLSLSPWGTPKSKYFH